MYGCSIIYVQYLIFHCCFYFLTFFVVILQQIYFCVTLIDYNIDLNLKKLHLVYIIIIIIE